jgi:hypothetical protein
VKTNNPTFTKLYTQILGMTEISGNAKLLLTFIVSHSENNQKFYYTNEDLMERLGVSSLSTMVRIVRELESFDLITSIQHKNFYFNEKNWGNRREINITNKTINIINETYIKKESIIETLPTPVEETIQPEEKATQIDENPSIESLLDYFEQLYISYDEPEEIYDKVKHKIEIGAIATFMEISAEYQLNKILSKKLKKESEKEFDENDKEITKESLLDYIENNASKLGWVKSIKIQDAVNNDSIKTINEILNF